jgi:hypothetical protein
MCSVLIIKTNPNNLQLWNSKGPPEFYRGTTVRTVRTKFSVPRIRFNQSISDEHHSEDEKKTRE